MTRPRREWLVGAPRLIARSSGRSGPCELRAMLRDRRNSMDRVPTQAPAQSLEQHLRQGLDRDLVEQIDGLRLKLEQEARAHTDRNRGCRQDDPLEPIAQQ